MRNSHLNYSVHSVLAQPTKTHRTQSRSKSSTALSLFCLYLFQKKQSMGCSTNSCVIRLESALICAAAISLFLLYFLWITNCERAGDEQIHSAIQFENSRADYVWIGCSLNELGSALNSTYLRLVNINIEYLASTEYRLSHTAQPHTQVYAADAIVCKPYFGIEVLDFDWEMRIAHWQTVTSWE